MTPMQGIARLGRNEDDTLAHVATGEMIVPPQSITPQTRSMIESDMMNMGMNPNQYVVGGQNSINPNTGMPEFFLKKLFKKVKNVVKKIAPIAVNFIPGVGPVAKAALTAAAGKASGMSTKEALLSGALSFGGSKLFGGSPTGAADTGRFSRIRKFFNPAEDAEGFLKTRFGIGQGKLGPNIRRGISSLFRPQQQLPEVEVVDGGPLGTTTYRTTDGQILTKTDLQNMGFSFDAAGNPVVPTQGSVSDYDPVTGKGQSRIGQIEDFLKGLGGGQKGQSGIGQIEDFLRGRQSDTVRKDDKFGLGNLGVAGLAGLVGKLAYEEAKKNKGVPLTPLTTMDQLGRYNIAAEIARQKGEEMPSRVEYGLNPEGMPILQGGGTGPTPRAAAMGGAIYAQADGDHNGIMQFADGGVVPMEEDVAVESTQGVIEEAMEIVRLAEIEPRIKDMPEYQAALNILGVSGIGSINPMPLVPGAKIGLEQGRLANTRMRKNIGRALGAVAAYAQGGVVEMANGGEPPIDPANFPPMDGDINGPGTETSDDIPAMLSDGEFVMTAKAVRGAGGFDMATNDSSGIVTLTPNGDPSRESGTRIMYKLMEHFGSVA
jgi:hypothetical protein